MFRGPGYGVRTMNFSEAAAMVQAAAAFFDSWCRQEMSKVPAAESSAPKTAQNSATPPTGSERRTSQATTLSTHVEVIRYQNSVGALEQDSMTGSPKHDGQLLRLRWSPRSIASAMRVTRYTRSVESVLSHATIRDRSSLAALFRCMVVFPLFWPRHIGL